MTDPASDHAGVVIPPPAVLLLAAAVAAAAEYWLPLPHLPSSFLAGAAVVVLAVLMNVSGFLKFIAAKVNPIPIKPAASLVTTGIYRFTRNPMYLGMVLILVGVAIWIGSIAFLLAAVAVFLFFNAYAIPREEAYLTRRFGRDYTDFCARVRRWL